MRLRVLYEDNHLLGVLKPPGLLTQADSSGHEDLLTICKAYLKEKYAKPGEVYLGLVHRLDRAVAGPVILARTSKAAARLSEQFRGRGIDKLYHAVVHGRPSPAQGERRDYLIKDAHQRKSLTARENQAGAQEARLNYRTLMTAEGPPPAFRFDLPPGRATPVGPCALVEVELLTGRFHQIRCQLAAMGHPILGDVKYGAPARLHRRKIGLEAVRLRFEHPTKREPVTIDGDFKLQERFGAVPDDQSSSSSSSAMSST